MPAATAKAITSPELKAIHALWRVIDAGRGEERESRSARLEYCSAVVKRPVASALELSSDEALRVIEAMKQETGQEWRPRGQWAVGSRQKAGAMSRSSLVTGHLSLIIGELAADLWGEHWHELLSARLNQRSRSSSVRSLAGWQARQLVEELLQRIAVRKIADRQPPAITRAEIEEEKAVLRKRFFVAAGLPRQYANGDVNSPLPPVDQVGNT
jgi:hypothetical protein